MEKINIDTMEAGRELDALVAERVMGWEWYQRVERQTKIRGYQGNNPRFLLGPEYVADFGGAYFDALFVLASEDAPYNGIVNESIPNYSTDIAAAWQVVEKISLHTFSIDFANLDAIKPDSRWKVTFSFRDKQWEAVANTAPLAICRAALKAVNAS